MKKTIINGILFLIIGFSIGRLFIIPNSKILTKISHKKNKVFYFLEEGIYANKESLKNNTNELSPKVVENKNNKFYVYVGITKNKNIADKIKKIYDKKGYTIHIKEKENLSEAFSINLKQFDLLIKESNSDDEIITIEEVVLANYEEIIKKA